MQTPEPLPTPQVRSTETWNNLRQQTGRRHPNPATDKNACNNDRYTSPEAVGRAELCNGVGMFFGVVTPHDIKASIQRGFKKGKWPLFKKDLKGTWPLLKNDLKGTRPLFKKDLKGKWPLFKKDLKRGSGNYLKRI